MMRLKTFHTKAMLTLLLTARAIPSRMNKRLQAEHSGGLWLSRHEEDKAEHTRERCRATLGAMVQELSRVTSCS